MATLSDIQYSLKGEQPDQQQQEVASMAVTEAIRPANKYVVFKLVNTKKNGGVYIPGVEDVINPDTKSVERMRLLAGVEGIWQKDQKDLPPDYVKQNLRSLEFPRGQKWLKIPEYDKAALKFARLSKHNVKGPNGIAGSQFGFFEYDPAEQAKEAYNREVLEIEMAIAVKEMPIETVKKMASYLNIHPLDDVGWPKTDDTIRTELMIRAKREPKVFKNLLGNKEVDIAFLVKKAILDSKIDLGKTTGSAHFATGGFICKIPPARKPQEFLTELACSPTAEGKQFLEQLQKITTQ